MKPAQHEWSLSARWVFPVDQPPLEHGVVVIVGERILAVEPAGRRTADRDLGNAAILPGLVNTHTHLDLTGMRGLCPPSPDFTGWLRQVIAHRRSVTVDQTQADIRAGIAECVRYGTTLVGDIASAGDSWRALADASLRANVFHEVIGLTPERAEQAETQLRDWLDGTEASSTRRKGVSLHAPYSVHHSLFTRYGGHGVPLAIHLAETEAELQLLATHDGPFVDFLQTLGVWNPQALVRSPEHVLELTRGANPVLYAHGNYLSPDAAIPPNGSITYCPRTHAAFGHPRHPFREFLARGVRVTLGTDGLSSNPDLDVLAEARFVQAKYPDLPGEVILRMATLSGAEALGWSDETGSLTPEKSADIVVLPLPDVDDMNPYRLVLESNLAIEEVIFRGRSSPTVKKM
jgi:cytosine/adenosine deaminase-related metal-dependent hydrolase